MSLAETEQKEIIISSLTTTTTTSFSSSSSNDLGKNLEPSHRYNIWKAKWQKQEYNVYWDEKTTINDLKEQLEEQTKVPAEKQQLVGFKPLNEFKDKIISINDNTLIHKLQCNKKKFIMIGTLQENAFNDDDVDNADVPFVLDDEDWNCSEEPEETAKRHKEHLKKLEKCISKTNINEIVPPRRGKKLLVLDIDNTLFALDGKQSTDWNTLKRPYTDHLLESCYPFYDIVIWSQTSWRWIEIKLTEMNMLMNSKYHITFVLDKKAMFTVVTNYFPSDVNKSKSKSKLGVARKHYVKPLELIWRKYPEFYHENNTIHIDDLARNFAMNPNCGLRVTPYYDARKNKDKDMELLYLTEYLLLIAKEENFRGLKHDRWKQFLEKKSHPSNF